MKKFLQQTGPTHDKGEDETLFAPPKLSPVEGKVEDRVKGVSVQALVVTTGYYMCVTVCYFVEERLRELRDCV